ncbi:hypothetical protein [Catenovulum sediminis]|uniref:DUF4347 domain-containing protein n=1 Tax=Catenovulum sediminis TaxID=1740262 RepID=A0ABV1RCA0_9ALTE
MSENVYVPKGAFVFMMHGNSQGVSPYSHGKTIWTVEDNFQDIVGMIEGAGYNGNKPLMMLSCDIAANGVGKALANYYKQPVIGASFGKIYIPGDASYSSYSYKPESDGATFVEF